MTEVSLSSPVYKISGNSKGFLLERMGIEPIYFHEQPIRRLDLQLCAERFVRRSPCDLYPRCPQSLLQCVERFFGLEIQFDLPFILFRVRWMSQQPDLGSAERDLCPIAVTAGGDQIAAQRFIEPDRAAMSSTCTIG